MAHAGDEPRLALESRTRAVARGEVLGQHFDRDVTAEPGGPGAVDLPHPAGTEGGNDLVGAEAAPGMEWHPMNLAQPGRRPLGLSPARIRTQARDPHSHSNEPRRTSSRPRALPAAAEPSRARPASSWCRAPATAGRSQVGLRAARPPGRRHPPAPPLPGPAR